MKRQKQTSPFWVKVKNLEVKKRYVFLLVALALLFRFWGENTITMLQRKVPEVTATEISSLEINQYIQTKQQYLSEHITISQDLIKSSDFENKLDKDIHEWFLVRNWRPKRFFYVENRIKLIVSCIQKQEEQLSKADELEEEAQHIVKTTGHFNDPSLNNSVKASNLIKEARDIRYYIKREIRQKGISIMEERNVRKLLSYLVPLVEDL